jgi:prepilin signal peptidase PulO-like enzyme (type II secretory pathway)
MTPILTIIFFIFGIIIGSFLNVVIFRLNTQKTFGGRSICLSCQHQLSWYELIPLFSFVFLRGRCKNCKTKISIQYPIVEFTVGLIFALLFVKFQDVFFLDVFIFSLTYAYYALMFSLLVVIAVYDIRHKIIPDILSVIFGILAFIGLFFFSAGGGSAFGGNAGFNLHLPTLFGFLSGLIIAAPFALLWLVSRGSWMGLGDAKLAIGLGWLFGIYSALSGIVIAFWIGAIVGIILVIFSKKYGMKSEIPLAPYLVLGTLLVFLFNLSLFGI